MEKLTILDVRGEPMRSSETDLCPQCGADPGQREPSSGFGVAHPMCARCGFEWVRETWHQRMWRDRT